MVVNSFKNFKNNYKKAVDNVYKTVYNSLQN